MHALLTTLRRGFKRWIGWKRLGIAASLLILFHFAGILTAVLAVVRCQPVASATGPLRSRCWMALTILQRRHNPER